MFLFGISFGYSQQGINYKALVKDGSGNVLMNQSVSVQLSILEGTAQTNVYQETHALTTDANGILMFNIGSGIVDSGDYSQISWGDDTHFLNVQIDSGAGLTDLGTTQFMAVPYALSAANVKGLQLIDEGNGEGYRLIGKDPLNYGDIGLKALDLSDTQVANDIAGATGESSVAIGNVAIAEGIGSIAIGTLVRSESFHATALGYRNEDYVGSLDTWVPTDPLFQIGNGGEFGESNALNILKNGTVLAPSFNISEITDGKALITKEYYDANTVSSTGLEVLDEGNGSGWRIIGRDDTKYDDIGLLAVDLSYSRFITDGGASGDYATAMGRETKAQAYSSLAIGRYNVGGGNSTSWQNADPLFEIGNGLNASNPSNALTILKDGTITAPSLAVGQITDDKALITKEYADTNLLGSGLEAINEGSGTGFRLIGKDPDNFGPVGSNAVDISTNLNPSTSAGATGSGSFTMGVSTTAEGSNSVAMGRSARANGSESFSFGSFCLASGDRSMAMGSTLDARSYNELVIGSFNTFYTPESTTDWDPDDRLFVIGNGTSTFDRNNAMTILKNGKLGLGTSSPEAFFEVSAVNSTGEPTMKLIQEGNSGARITFTDTGVNNGNNWTLFGDADDNDAASIFNIFHPNKGNILRIQGNGEVGVNGLPNTEFHVFHGATSGTDGFKLQNTAVNENWWRIYTVNSTGNLNLYSKDQGATSVGFFNDTSGAYSATSDRRRKKDFNDLHFKWVDFMKLEPLTYRYKAQEDDQIHMGLVAQDVEAIYPELVNYNEDEDVYHLNYSGFGVVAIKAIQEQQKLIEDQVSKIEAALGGSQ